MLQRMGQRDLVRAASVVARAATVEVNDAIPAVVLEEDQVVEAVAVEVGVVVSVEVNAAMVAVAALDFPQVVVGAKIDLAMRTSPSSETLCQ